MDYMHLGVRARKTGLNVKQGLQKDEYSMENIDDFFNDDSTSHVSDKRKSRRSSMLSLLSGTNSFSLPSAIEQRQQEQSPGVPLSSSRRTSKLHRFSPNQYDLIEEEPIPEFPSEDPANTSIPPASNKFEAPQDGSSIRLTPEKATDTGVPDLVHDDEDTRDYTSFNTSENALLDDEMDDDYEVISEDDRDYIDGESSLEDASNSSSSSDGDTSDDIDSDITENDSIIKNSNTVTDSLIYQNYGYDGVPSEIYDSDEEYIQNQAKELENEGYSAGSNGVRRSKRVKIAPLEWWRNEKVVYKRKSTKPVLEIDKIITYDKKIDEEEEEELAFHRQKRKKKSSTRARPYNYIPTGKPRGRPRKHKPLNTQENPNADLLEEINDGKIASAEWLKHGILEANVNVTMDRTSDEIIAFAPNLAQSEKIKETEEEHFSLEVMFDKHKDHFASGMLKIPRHARKTKSDSYNAFITFFVVQGIVEVTLSSNTFLCTEGSTFQIPSFNEYGFQNRGNNEVKMFFTQVTVSENEFHHHSSSIESSDNEMPSRLLTEGDAAIDSNHNSESTSDNVTPSRRTTLSSMIISDI
ncbi:related to protein MIF2 [Zygosaccharomyces bailii]|nr:related to protein MIF2 [Zygosaccharomyces bailii]